jgi:UDP-GlcNAc3NAcA epimerase
MDVMNPMQHVLIVVGARPQFVKGAAMHRALASRSGWKATWLHAGQHHDEALSAQFFQEFGLPEPDIRLQPNQANRALRLGDMMAGIEQAVRRRRPDWVMVFGDTDSTLAGAWAANACRVPLVHVEAGLRSDDWDMPEEANRVLTDRLSSVLVCPTNEAVLRLESEGIRDHSSAGVPPSQATPWVLKTGDIMHDNVVHASQAFAPGRRGTGAVLLTMHRPANVDDVPTLLGWLEAVGSWAAQTGQRVKFPIHPRTRARLEASFPTWEGALKEQGLEVLEPMGYSALLKAIYEAPLVVTDSGGVQKESYSLGTRCLVLRDTTEWTDQVARGQSELVSDASLLDEAARRMQALGPYKVDDLYGTGRAAAAILDCLEAQSELHG